MSKQHDKVSKYLSYLLRHKPEAIGLALDSEGWAEINRLIICASCDGRKLDIPLIQAVVDGNDKKRFAISDDGRRIRAVQGHSSSKVDISYQEKVPPKFLYHGTATRFIDSIYRQGLLAGSRQYVHLSADRSTAVSVGQRHGKAIVLTVGAQQMYQQEFKFYQAENGVWLTKNVPVSYLTQ